MSANPAYDVLARYLRALVETHGRGLFDERRRLIGLLLDHAPELRREVRAVAMAVDEGVATALAAVDRPLAGITIDRQTARLEDEAALRPDVARGVTRALAHALGLGPEPGVYAQAAPPPAPPLPVPTAPVIGQYSAPTYVSQQRSRFSTSDPKMMRAAILGGALAVAAVVVVVPRLVDTTADAPAIATGTDTGPNAAKGGYAGELTDYRVAAQKQLRDNVGSPTPLDIPAGRRITTDDLRTLSRRDKKLVLIDVLAGAHPQTLQGAHYLATAGSPGDFDDAIQAQLDASLKRLTDNRTDTPLAFFCAGAQCWESYNAVLRAHALGYSKVIWYRGGLASWSEAGLPMQETPAPSDA